MLNTLGDFLALSKKADVLNITKLAFVQRSLNTEKSTPLPRDRTHFNIYAQLQKLYDILFAKRFFFIINETKHYRFRLGLK